MLHHQEASVAADVPARHRRHAGAAVARVDGAGGDGAGADRGQRRTHAARRIYFPHGATMDKWTPATEGAGFELTEILQPLKPFHDAVNIISDLSHPQAYGGGSATVESQPLGGDVPERRARRGRRAGAPRHHRRSGRRAAHRPGHAAAVARADDRGREPQLRRRPELRLPRHDLVAETDVAAADAEQPAGGVRAAVRRRQHRRASAARGASSRSACSIRCSAKRRRCSRRCRRSIATRLDQYLNDMREIERRIQKAVAAGVDRSRRCRTRRPACRRTSKTTSS